MLNKYLDKVDKLTEEERKIIIRILNILSFQAMLYEKKDNNV